MRRELTTAFAAMATLITLAFLVPLGLSARLQGRDRALDEGRSVAAHLVPLAAAGRQGEVAHLVDRINAAGRQRVTVVIGGQVIGEAAPESARLAQALDGAASSSGDAPGGVELVTAVAGVGGTSAVRVLVTDAELSRGLAAAWAALAATGLALVGLSVAIADRIAQRVVRPARRLADAAHRLGSGELAVMVEPSGPAELVDTADAFNRLTGQVQGMLAAEREMVGELTHRLRTPLTRLRIDLDRVADEGLAADLHADVDALRDEIDDLIAQARRTADPPRPIDVTGVAAERYGFWRALAADEHRPCRLVLSGVPVDPDAPGAVWEPVTVAVEPEALAAGLDVLFENVFAHTERGVAFELSVAAGPGGGCVITLDDAGPGFDPSMAAAGRSGGGSSGLGLAILGRLARASSGSMTIEPSPMGGARVVCRLGTGAPRTAFVV
ncbi:MAG: HAMP domain-containing protein [Acidimicrobiia bacterium]|nr:HAMP domain-containing protein [Acidimicrobiia bacterium]